MRFRFIADMLNRKSILLYDITKVEPTMTEDIYKMTLVIHGRNIPNPTHSVEIDLLNYLRNKRVNHELYVIRSEDLLLGNEQLIPDGVYYFTIHINNKNYYIVKNF